MRKTKIEHRPSFVRGLVVGLVLILAKLIIELPIDAADVLYGVSLLITLAITFGDFVEWDSFVLHPRVLDFLLGFLFPLDAYAVLVLFGLPLPN